MIKVTKAMISAVQAKLASAGGKARAANMTVEQRSAAAAKANRARYARPNPVLIARNAEIVKQRAVGYTGPELAKKFDLHLQTIWQVLRKAKAKKP